MFNDVLLLHHMRLINLLSDTDRIVRTQITLTSELKKLIEKKAKLKGESLSGYLRRAAMLQLRREAQEKKDLEELANKVIGSIDLEKHSYWKDKKSVNKWLRNLRSEWE